MLEEPGQGDDNVPVDNKFNVLVEAVKKLIKLFSLEDVKKAIAMYDTI